MKMLKILETQYFTVCELAEKSGLPESTVRYYLQQVLRDYMTSKFPDLKTKQGKTSHYPAQVLDRLRFIRLAKEELELTTGNRRSPTVNEIKYWMDSLSDRQIGDVLDGKDTLEFGIDRIKDGVRQIEKLEQEENARPDSDNDTPPDYQVIKIAPGVEIRHTKSLSPDQRRLMLPIVSLLKLVFEGEQKC